MRFRISGRTAVVTGAASGIGAALAHELHALGCRLVLIDRDEAGLKRVADALGGDGVDIHVLDLRDRAATLAVARDIAAAHRRIDILVNNAGIAAMGRFDQTSLEEFEAVMDVNFWGAVIMTKALLDSLSADARIANLSSIFGIAAPPGQVPYAASKFAIRGFSEALRHEFADTGVRVICVHPGGVRTAIARNARIASTIDDAAAAEAQGDFGRFLRTQPEAAARRIATAIVKGSPRVLIGGDARGGDLLVRMMPARYGRVIARLMGGMRRHVGTPPTGGRP